MSTAVPQLMFEGAVADIIALWSRAFPEMSVEVLMGSKEAPSLAQVTVAGQRLRLFDSPAPHEFSLTPSFSLVVTCGDAKEVDHLAEILGEGGQVFMPLGPYDFSPHFTWIADRFGVSWQLMLPAGEAG